MVFDDRQYPPPPTDKPSWMSAARMGDIELIDHYLEAGMPIDHTDSNGFTALHIAANYDQILMVRHLLGKGFSAAHANKWGDTPLHRAAAQGFAAMCQLLLESGADPEAMDGRNQTAADYAKWELNRGAMKVFREWRQAHPVVPVWERPPLPKLPQAESVEPPRAMQHQYPTTGLFGGDGVSPYKFETA